MLFTFGIAKLNITAKKFEGMNSFLLANVLDLDFCRQSDP